MNTQIDWWCILILLFSFFSFRPKFKNKFSFRSKLMSQTNRHFGLWNSNDDYINITCRMCHSCVYALEFACELSFSMNQRNRYGKTATTSTKKKQKKTFSRRRWTYAVGRVNWQKWTQKKKKKKENRTQQKRTETDKFADCTILIAEPTPTSPENC